MSWNPIDSLPRDAVVLITVVPTEENTTFRNKNMALTQPVYIDEDGRIYGADSCKPDPGIAGGMWIATHWMGLPDPAPQQE